VVRESETERRRCPCRMWAFEGIDELRGDRFYGAKKGTRFDEYKNGRSQTRHAKSRSVLSSVRSMFRSMAHNAKPYYIEFEGVTAIVMSMRFAFNTAIRAFIWPYQFTDTNGIVNSILGFEFFRMLFPCPALFLQSFFRMVFVPISMLFGGSSRMGDFPAVVIFTPFRRVSFSPFPLLFSGLWHGLILSQST
jgi:hypothetical protein